jgi:hypothetical protein
MLLFHNVRRGDTTPSGPFAGPRAVRRSLGVRRLIPLRAVT